MDISKKNLQILYENCMSNNPCSKSNYTLPKELNPFAISNKNIFLENKQMANINIPNIQKSVICGTCIGDSSIKINKNYKNARIQCRHSTKQASWFFWKWVICLKDYSNGLNSITLQKPDGKQINQSVILKHIEDPHLIGKLKITTRADENLTKLHNIICKKNKIEITRKWLNHMSNYFLMTLWLDDGSLYNKRQGVFCLDSIPFEQQKILSVYLKSVWNIDCFVQETKIKMKNGKISYRLFISNQESLLLFLKLIAPIIPVREMLYKIMFVPKNNIYLLERWASEIVNLVDIDFKDQIKKDYDKIIYAEYQKKI